jgi:hypothetical protein
MIKSYNNTCVLHIHNAICMYIIVATFIINFIYKSTHDDTIWFMHISAIFERWSRFSD